MKLITFEVFFLQILANGEIQVTEKERQAQADSQLHDVATFVAGQCVQIRPKAPPLPLSTALVEKAMRELHIALRPNRSTKQNVSDIFTLSRVYEEFTTTSIYS